MDSDQAVAVLSALAQPTRLSIFRFLIRAGTAGVPAGEIAKQVAAPQNTVSSHLSTLAHAGLVSSERDGRMVRYRIDLGTTGDLLEYLMKDCCAGNPDICLPLLRDLDDTTGCAAPARTAAPDNKDIDHGD